MLRRQQFEQGDQRIVVRLVLVAQRFLVVLEVEVGEFDLGRQGGNERLSNLPVEEIGLRIRQSSPFKLVELLHKLLVLGEQAVEQGGIENEPLVNVRDDQMPYFQVLMRDPFPQVIQHQFLKRLGIQILSGDHLRLVRRLLRLHYNPDRGRRIRSVVDHQIVPALGIDKVGRVVIRLLQKVADQVLMKLLAFGIVGPIQQSHQIRLEPFDR